MKTFGTFRVVFLVFLASLVFTPVSNATVVSDIAWVLDQMGSANPFPVNGPMLRSSEGLITCIGDGGDVAKCFQEHQGDELASQVSSENLPSWFEDIIGCYIAFKKDDYWAAIGYLSEAAICVLAEVLSGGDLCAIIEGLLNAAEAVGTAIVEFFEDIGAAFAQLGEAIYCGIFSCPDDPPPPPPPQRVIYEHDYVPKLAEGLSLRKQFSWLNGDLKFQQWLKNFDNSEYNFVAGLLVGRHVQFAYQDVWNIIHAASDSYRKQLNANWTKDVLQKDNPSLAEERTRYDSPETIKSLQDQIVAAAKDLAKPGPGESTYPVYQPPISSTLDKIFVARCKSHFSKYAHIDYWIHTYPGDSSNAKMVTTEKWCADLARKYESEMAAFINGQVPASCKWDRVNRKNRCESLDDLRTCIAIKSLIGQKEACSVNAGVIGTKIANEIAASFQQKGSNIKCRIRSHGIAAPVELTCYRPKQQKNCEWQYGAYSSLPEKVLTCVLDIPPEYKALQDKVRGVAMNLKNGRDAHAAAPSASDAKRAQLVKTAVTGAAAADKGKPVSVAKPGTAGPVQQKKSCENRVEISDDDPLLVNAEECVVNRMKADPNQNLGFGSPSSVPGFRYTADNSPAVAIDGLSTPVLFQKWSTFTGGTVQPPPRQDPARESAQQVIQDKLKDTKGGVQPRPVEDKRVGRDAVTSPAASAQASRPAAMDAIKRDKAPSSGSVTQARPSALEAVKQDATRAAVITAQVPSAGMQQEQTKVMSGPVPSGTARSGSPPPQMARAVERLLPDLTVGPAGIGGKAVSWGKGITLEAGSLSRGLDGFCTIVFQYSIRNVGRGAAGPFTTALTSSTSPGVKEKAWPGLPAGDLVTQNEKIRVTAGQSILTLTIDSKNELQETTRQNNSFRVPVTVTGSCKPMKPIIPR